MGFAVTPSFGCGYPSGLATPRPLRRPKTCPLRVPRFELLDVAENVLVQVGVIFAQFVDQGAEFRGQGNADIADGAGGFAATVGNFLL